MVSNANNDRMADEQIVMIQTLQTQMEELRQKGIANQLRNEEDRRRYEEEMNKYLPQRLDGHEREEQSKAPPTAPQTHPAPQTHQTHQTH